MKIFSLLLFCALSLAVRAENNGRVVVNTVVAIVYPDEGDSVAILLSDLKPGVDGAVRTKESEIDRHLILADAQRFKIEVSNENIESYLAQVQKENNLSRKDLEQMFDDLGYTFEEGREFLRTNQIVEMTLNFKIKSHIVIDKKEVEDYYCAHSPTSQREYTIQFGSLPAALFEGLESDKMELVNWDEPLVVQENELAADKFFIKNLALSVPAVLEERGKTVELIRVVDTKESQRVLLDEDYSRIETLLKKEKYEHALANYKAELRSRES